MAVEFEWPWLGIAIPTFLISFIGYCAHYFILSNYLPFEKQIWFECSLSMVWLSYYLAIITSPGNPPSKFKPLKCQWNQFCNKCNNYKPERAHHCKKCQSCILVMDHHCPWTNNCVGYKNFPHFMRFLFWVIATTGFLGYELGKRILFLWKKRHERDFFHKSELYFLTILTPLNAFVLLTISMLFLRCVKNQIFNGMTQIESWEMERIENLFENRRLIPQLIDNLKELHPRTVLNEADCRNLSSNNSTRMHEVINFPYDVNPWVNANLFMNNIFYWLVPWGCPAGSGVTFQNNDISTYEFNSPLADKLLSLPWPPDGGRQKPLKSDSTDTNVEVSTQSGEHVIRKRWVDPRTEMPRTQWYNDWGENLSDFGVDVDAEINK